MAAPSPAYSLILRVRVPASIDATSTITAGVAAAGAAVTALDIVESAAEHLTVDVSCNVSDEAHRDHLISSLEAQEDVEVSKVSDRTFLIHRRQDRGHPPRLPAQP